MNFIVVLFLIWISLYFSKVNSYFVIWKLNKRYGIETTTGCIFEKNNKIVEKYLNDTEGKCGKSCLKNNKCTHYFWYHNVCLIKSGFIYKNNVMKAVDKQHSECGILPERIRKIII